MLGRQMFLMPHSTFLLVGVRHPLQLLDDSPAIYVAGVMPAVKQVVEPVWIVYAYQSRVQGYDASRSTSVEG